MIAFALLIAALATVVFAIWAFLRNFERPTPLSVLTGGACGLLTAVPGFMADDAVGVFVFTFATMELAAALSGAGRCWPRTRLTLLRASSMAVALLLGATLVQVFRPREAAFVAPLAELPAGCPAGGTSVLARAARGEAELREGVIVISDGARTTTVDAPPRVSSEPTWYTGCETSPLQVGDRPDGLCVGYDPQGCGYHDPQVVLLDEDLRPWPSALDRLEARAGAIVRGWLVVAIAASIALLALGLWLASRWRRLLTSAERGTLSLAEGGWVFYREGHPHPLDLRGARIFGTLSPGECRVVARASPRGDPYRTASTLRVRQIACGDRESIAKEVAHRRFRIWTVLLGLVATLVVPVTIGILDVYRFAPS